MPARQKQAIQGENKDKAGKGRQQDFKALKCFISLKNESGKNGRTEKTDPFFHLKKIKNKSHHMQKLNKQKNRLQRCIFKRLESVLISNHLGI